MSSSRVVDESLLDGCSAEQIFRTENSNGLTFDDIIALVRRTSAMRPFLGSDLSLISAAAWIHRLWLR